MQTTIAFWPPLVFTLCPSSRRFQLRCLAHFFGHSSRSGVYYMFCRLCFNFHGPEGLENARMSFLFHFLLFSYKIKPILPIFLARIRSWDEIIWSPLTWRSCEGSKRVIGPLQAGRSTRYPASIETPVFMEHKKRVLTPRWLGRKGMWCICHQMLKGISCNRKTSILNCQWQERRRCKAQRMSFMCREIKLTFLDFSFKGKRIIGGTYLKIDHFLPKIHNSKIICSHLKSSPDTCVEEYNDNEITKYINHLMVVLSFYSL